MSKVQPQKQRILVQLLDDDGNIVHETMPPVEHKGPTHSLQDCHRTAGDTQVSRPSSESAELKAFCKNLARAVGVSHMPPATRNSTPKMSPPVVKAQKKGRKPKPGRKPKGLIDKIGNYRVADAYSDGVKAWRFIKEYLNVEEKMFDATDTDVAMTTTGAVRNLSNIAQGDDWNSRDGNSILVQKLRLSFHVTSNVLSAAFDSPSVRVMVLRDELRNAITDPAPADILELGGTASCAISPLLHWHDGNRAAKRFRVLMDESFALNTQYATTVSTTATGNVDLRGRQRHMMTRVFNVNAHTMFQSTAGADASDWVGALYLFFCCDQSSNGPTMTYYSRVYFTDN